MNDFLNRQIAVLRQLVDGYRSGRLALNALIQRIQAIGDVLEIDEWEDAALPIVWSMEQINAFAIEEKRDLTEAEKASIESSLLELESVMKRFEVQ